MKKTKHEASWESTNGDWFSVSIRKKRCVLSFRHANKFTTNQKEIQRFEHSKGVFFSIIEQEIENMIGESDLMVSEIINEVTYSGFFTKERP